MNSGKCIGGPLDGTYRESSGTVISSSSWNGYYQFAPDGWKWHSK